VDRRSLRGLAPDSCGPAPEAAGLGLEIDFTRSEDVDERDRRAHEERPLRALRAAAMPGRSVSWSFPMSTISRSGKVLRVARAARRHGAAAGGWRGRTRRPGPSAYPELVQDDRREVVITEEVRTLALPHASRMGERGRRIDARDVAALARAVRSSDPAGVGEIYRARSDAESLRCGAVLGRRARRVASSIPTGMLMTYRNDSARRPSESEVPSGMMRACDCATTRGDQGPAEVA